MTFEVQISRIGSDPDVQQPSSISSRVHHDTKDDNPYYTSDNQIRKPLNKLDKVYRVTNSRRPFNRWSLKSRHRRPQQQLLEPIETPARTPIFNPDIDQASPPSDPSVPDESAQIKSTVLLPNLQGPSEGLYYGLIEPGVPGKPIFTPDLTQLQQPPSYSEHASEPLDNTATSNPIDDYYNEFQQQHHYAIDDYNSHYEATTYSYSSYPRPPIRKCKVLHNKFNTQKSKGLKD